MPNIHTVAFNLAQQGVRVIELDTGWRKDYVFAGGWRCDVSTADRGFDRKMQQLPRVVAALVEQYLRVVGFIKGESNVSENAESREASVVSVSL